MLVNILGITDDAKCYEMVRHLRWPDGVRCPHCDSDQVVKQGRDETEPQRQRYECRACGRRFDDLTDTIFAGHHQPLRVWVLVLYFMGLNLSNEQIAKELDLDPDDAQRMTTLLRDGIVQRKPEVKLSGEVECDEVYVVAGPQGPSRGGQEKGRPGRRRRLKGAPGRGTLAKEKPPIFGMIQRTGEVVIRMLADVKQKTIGPLIKATIAPGSASLHRRVRHLPPAPRVGLHPPHGVPCGGGVRPGRRRGRVLRGARQHDGRVLVAAAELAAAAPGGLAGEVAAVPGVLRVRAQRPATGQGPPRSPGRIAPQAIPRNTG